MKKSYIQKEIDEYLPEPEEDPSDKSDSMEIETIKNKNNIKKKTLKAHKPIKKSKMLEDKIEKQKEILSGVLFDQDNVSINPSESMSQKSNFISPDDKNKKAFRWLHFEKIDEKLRCIHCFRNDPNNPTFYAVGCSNQSLKNHVNFFQENENKKITEFYERIMN